MREYNQLSYVTCLEYNSSAMITSKEDELPNSGSLKKLILNKPELGEISPEQVPNSVEILEYPLINKKYQTKLIGLPNSVTTVRNVFFSCHHTFIEIPKTIKSLHFTGWPNYNQELFVDGWLSKSNVETLNLGYNWNNGGAKLNVNVFPSTLTDLNLGDYQNGFSDGLLPNTIEKLKISLFSKKQSVTSDLIPSSVKYLIISIGNYIVLNTARISSLPSTVTSLEYNRIDLLNNGILTKEMIPSSLISFSFTTLNILFIEYDSLPITLKSFKSLFYNEGWNQEINNLFSRLSSLTYLEISNQGFNQQLFVNSFPASLETLIIGSKSFLNGSCSSFNQPFDQCFSFPSSLTFLGLYCPKFKYEIKNDDIFPSSLKIIELTNNFKSLLNNNLFNNNKSKIKFIN